MPAPLRHLCLLLLALTPGPALAQVVYVDDDATGANDGSSWADAFNRLDDALAAAQGTDQVWLAEGLYVPSSTLNRLESFEIAGSVVVHGGFVGTEDSLDARQGSAAGTILSGDLLGDDGPNFTNRSDNSLHVVTVAYFVSGGIERVTVRGGQADQPGHEEGGGLLAILGSDDVAVDCIFTDNYAARGGGAFGSGYTSFVDCTFVGNRALEHGGGLSVSLWQTATPLVLRCRFIENEVTSGGGANGDGGGLWGNWGELRYCEFIGNRAPRGGALAWSGPAWGLSIVGNTASQETGGAVLWYGTLRSSILWGNSDPSGFTDAAQVAGMVGDVNESCIQGWTGAMGGARNMGADPMFVDPIGPDGLPGTGDEDLGLRRGSACVDRGQQSNWVISTTDSRGQPRRVDSIDCGDGGVIDMGAIERQEIDGSSSYCDAAPSSLGTPAHLSAPCTLSLFLDPALELEARPVPDGLSVFVVSPEPGESLLGDGLLCIGSNLVRVARTRSVGGTASVEIDLGAPPAAGLFLPGSTWFVQAIYRDLAGGSAGFNLSDAVSLEIRN